MFFVRPLSERHVSSGTIYIINTDMADITAFFQDKWESIKEVKTFINQVMLRATVTQRGS